MCASEPKLGDLLVDFTVLMQLRTLICLTRDITSQLLEITMLVYISKTHSAKERRAEGENVCTVGVGGWLVVVDRVRAEV